MAEELLLHVRNDARELGRVAAAVANFGAGHGLAREDVFDVTLSVDEVLTNVIWYAFEAGSEHDIVLRVAVEDGVLTAELEDDGRAFDPLAEAPEVEAHVPLEDRKVGGLGIHLVRRAMDGLAYRREMGKNILTMRKRLRPRE